MSLASPVLLIVGLLAAAALGWAAAVLSQRRAASLAAAGVTAPGRARQAGVWLTIAGIAVLAVAAAGPAASVPVPRAAGTVILAMDVSGSMGARDVAPTRLAAAQRAARSFIQAQPDSVDIGVVAFEEGAITTARPSADHSVAEAAIGRLAVTGGTSLGSAIIASLSAITGKTFSVPRGGTAAGIGYWPSATIVIFSDGQDEGEGPAWLRPPRSPRRRASISTPSVSAPPPGPPSMLTAIACTPRSTRAPSSRSRVPPAARTTPPRTPASSTASRRRSTCGSPSRTGRCLWPARSSPWRSRCSPQAPCSPSSDRAG